MNHIVICASYQGGDLHYWTGLGLSDDSNRAARFATNKDAKAEWREHRNAFSGWKLQLESL